MAKLVVAGCSYSDRTKVRLCYGDYLSKMLGYKYIHLARGSSSNDRSWFKLSMQIIHGEITSSDIVILQYTDLFRKLLPSTPPYKNPTSLFNTPGQIETHNTAYGKMHTSDFKMHSHQWQEEDENKILHKAFEDFGICTEYDCAMFVSKHKQFEALCEVNNIKLVVLLNRYTNIRPDDDVPLDLSSVLGEQVRNRSIHEDTVILQGNETLPAPHDLGWIGNVYDSAHLSKAGHKALAAGLHQHLLGHKLLDTH
tara:strand:+ start:344 stop:1102 length:759 start_codon:yes stop_codon:yes gene_type:complete